MKYIFSAILLLTALFSVAQTEILPLTGFKVYSEGISYSDIEIRLEDSYWVSNRLPLEKSFEIKILKPTGFAANEGYLEPGIEVCLTNMKADTLGYVSDMYGGKGEQLIPEDYFKSLKLSLALSEGLFPGDTVLLYARFFDYLSENYLAVQNSLIVSSEKELPQTTSSLFSSISYPSNCTAAGNVEFNGFDYSNTNMTKENAVFDFKEITIGNKLWVGNATVILQYYKSDGSFYEEYLLTSEDLNRISIENLTNDSFDLRIKPDYLHLNEVEFFRVRVQAPEEYVIDGVVKFQDN